MIELLKLTWDAIVLRDAGRKRMLNWPLIIAGIGMAITLYVILIPAVLLWEKHPQYKPVFIAAVAVDTVMFLTYMFFAVRWWIRTLRAQA